MSAVLQPESSPNNCAVPIVTAMPSCRRGLKLNPITSLYYISPACFGFLLLPFLMFELPKIRNDPSVQINPAVLLSNAAAAFGEADFARQHSKSCLRCKAQHADGQV